MSAASPATQGYRPDIDGLRAIAVLAVIWFHSSLPGLPGGFAGVDIFFVISGFLITGIIAREQAAGQFSFARFYQRRFRRIAPALLTVLLTVLIVSYILLLPGDLIELGKSALATLGMVPNIHFWLDSSGGYFGMSKRLSPLLLHTWSLGVEEQFYLLFPLFMVLAARWRAMRAALIGATILSFALCFIVGTYRSPVAAFYLLPTRAWELGLGALIAIGVFTVTPRLRTPFALLGTALIAASLLLLDDASPNWWMAAPAIGAALLISGGVDAPAGRVLSLSPLVWLGRISYSLYLWHWPVFIILPYMRAEEKLSADLAILGIGVSIVLAALTWWLIEQPARRRDTSFRKLFTAGVAAAIICAAMAGYAVKSAGVPQRFSPSVLAIAAQAKDRAPLAVSCIDVPLDKVLNRCMIGQGPPTAVIWGNSHASADSAGIAAGLDRPTVVLATGGCAPELKLVAETEDWCATRNHNALEWIRKHPEIDTVTLVAHWQGRKKAVGPEQWQKIQQMIDALPGRRVIVIAGTPEPGVDVPWASAVRAANGSPSLKLKCTSVGNPVRGALVVDLAEAFCAHPKPWMLFTDRNHPSMTANEEVIAPTLRAALQQSAAQ